MIGRAVPVATFFRPEQRRQLEVLLEAILPGTDDSPGATDAAAAEMVDRLLGAEPPIYYEVPAWRALYLEALPAVDAACRARTGKPLAEAAPDQVTALVAHLAVGKVEELPPSVDQRRLFGVLRSHCIEGCFADPRWGGNREALIWRWYGYPAGPAQDFHRGRQR